MRALIDILSGYEGAIQEVEEDHSEENIAQLEKARTELMAVLQEAKKLEQYKEALIWAMMRLDYHRLRREGCGNDPEKYNEIQKLIRGDSNGTVVSEGSGSQACGKVSGYTC